MDGNGLFLGQIASHDLKALAITFRVSVRHLVNGLLGQTVHKSCNL